MKNKTYKKQEKREKEKADFFDWRPELCVAELLKLSCFLNCKQKKLKHIKSKQLTHKNNQKTQSLSFFLINRRSSLFICFSVSPQLISVSLFLYLTLTFIFACRCESIFFSCCRVMAQKRDARRFGMPHWIYINTHNARQKETQHIHTRQDIMTSWSHHDCTITYLWPHRVMSCENVRERDSCCAWTTESGHQSSRATPI